MTACHEVEATTPVAVESYLGRDVPTIEPIAIVGLACKLPGNVNTTSDLWDLLINVTSDQFETPAHQSNADALPDAHEDSPSTLPAREGYAIREGMRSFDNEFFGISDSEAARMGVQQGKLLEVAYECLESAGQSLESIKGANVGCYVAENRTDRLSIHYRDVDISRANIALRTCANLVNHAFDLNGPSVLLNASCSSALYGLHMACVALRNRECEGAIVANVNLTLIPKANQEHHSDDTDTSHDTSADTYDESEGVVVLYCKRLDNALRDGDPIRSVIRGTAVNNNDHSTNECLKAPLVHERAISKVYQNAGLPISQTQYVEVHDNRSILDLTDIQAVAKAYQRDRANSDLLIGSMKLSIGPNDTTSGLVSIIKVTLAMEHGIIPPTIGTSKPTVPHSDSDARVKVVTEATPWPGGALNLAGISSIGGGGANAHVILESKVRHNAGRATDLDSDALQENHVQRLFLIPLSAHDSAQIDAVAEAYADYLSHTKDTFTDFLHTIGSRRTHLSCRSYVVSTRKAIETDLRPSTSRLVRAKPRITQAAPNLGFIFSGQGAQWCDMAVDLLAGFGVFQRSIHALDYVLQNLPDAPKWKLQTMLDGSNEAPSIDEPEVAQTLITALQIGLIDLLASWNVLPNLVVGHSSGEIAAAYAAGAFDASVAITIAYYRGAVIQKTSVSGAMAVIGIDGLTAQDRIYTTGAGNDITVACYNSTESCVVSGDSDAIDILVARLNSDSIFARKLRTSGRAYHSHHMLPVADQFNTHLKDVFDQYSEQAVKSKIRMFSTLRGREIDVGTLRQPAYWCENLVRPVQFDAAFQYAIQQPRVGFIEVGPHTVLKSSMESIWSSNQLASNRLAYFPSLMRNRPTIRTILSLAGDLYTLGYDVDLDQVNGITGQCQVLTELPHYPWNHRSSPYCDPATRNLNAELERTRHPVLGNSIASNGKKTQSWRSRIYVQDFFWLNDHKIDTDAVIPTSFYVGLVVEGLREMYTRSAREKSIVIRNFRSANMAIVPEGDGGLEVVLEFEDLSISQSPRSECRYGFDVRSLTGGSWLSHATGEISLEDRLPTQVMRAFQSDHCDEVHPINKWYSRLAEMGIRLGPGLQTIKTLRFASKDMHVYTSEAMAGVQLPQEKTLDLKWANHSLHPLLVESLFQTALFSNAAGDLKELSGCTPSSFEEMFIENLQPSHEGTAFANSSPVSFGRTVHQCELLDDNGRIIITVRGLRMTEYCTKTIIDKIATRNPILRIDWKPDLWSLELLNAPAFSAYLRDIEIQNLLPSVCPSQEMISKILLIAIHNNPSTRILELRPSADTSMSSLATVLSPINGMPRFDTLVSASIENKNFVGQRVKASEISQWEASRQSDSIIDVEATFDIIICSSPGYWKTCLEEHHATLGPYLSAECLIVELEPTVMVCDEDWRCDRYASPVFSEQVSTDCGRTVTLAVSKVSHVSSTTRKPKELPRIYYIYDSDMKCLDQDMCHMLEHEYRTRIKRLPFDAFEDIDLIPGSIVLMAVAVQRPLLPEMTATELRCLQKLTDGASVLIWLTAGGLIGAKDPNRALINGLSRAVMHEQPTLKFLVVDIQNGAHSDKQHELTCRHVIQILDRSLDHYVPEYEYAESDGMLFRSRFLPDEEYNKAFQSKELGALTEVALEECGELELTRLRPGHPDSLGFKALSLSSDKAKIQPGCVQLQVKAAGINQEDGNVAFGLAESQRCCTNIESAGIVVESSSQKFRPGDRVVTMAPNRLRNTQVVPEWTCVKLLDTEQYAEMAALPFNFATAMYALYHCANIQKGESILISSAAEPLGEAAIQIAQLRDARIYATVDGEQERDHLISKYGLLEQNVLLTGNDSFATAILDDTKGDGVDIIMNSASNDWLAAALSAIAEFGRIVDLQQGRTAPENVSDILFRRRNVSFHACDVANLYYCGKRSRQNIWSSLLQDSVAMYREGIITHVQPIEIFDAADVAKAFGKTQTASTTSKPVIVFDRPNCFAKIKPLRHEAQFSGSKHYLMVGALGGIGRSISRWMLRRGARHFTFLNRSGMDKIEARQLISELASAGAHVRIIHGTVDCQEDVERAIADITGPIGGVVNAAMELDESLFTSMTHQQWHHVLSPKVKGTWNLHRALQPHEATLDFFILTSSISGSVGSATETNYCAANSFLDQFARYRRNLGLTAVSIGLGMVSEVGYLHENPEIEKVLLRKGVQAINEAELIQLFDIAVAQESDACALSSRQNGHLLTGLEPLSLDIQRRHGLEGYSHILDDPRAELIAQHFWQNAGAEARLITDTAGSVDMTTVNDGDLRAMIQEIITKEVADLTFEPADKINPAATLSSLGINSMLAAEFRTDIFHSVSVDVPFVTILNAETTVDSLATLITERLRSEDEIF